MINITIDTASIEQHMASRIEAVAQEAVDVLGEFAMARMRQLSGDKLGVKQQQHFVNELTTRREKSAFIIELKDPRAIAYERGIDPFDIKPGLLNSPSAKTGASGKYVDVPFEHATSKRGKGTYVESRNMRSAIRKAQQKLGASGGGSKTRLFQTGAAKKSIQGDMVVTTSRAQTFRRVSENSDPSSWRHPGTDGVNVFEVVAEEVEKQAPQVVADIIKKASRT